MLATDVYLGAWLMYSGAELKRVQISRSNGKPTAVFEFDGPGLDEHAAEWFEERAVANLGAYRRQLESLKDHLFDAIRKNETERRTDDANHYHHDHHTRTRPLARR